MIIINKDILNDSIQLKALLEKEKTYMQNCLKSQQKFKTILIDYMQKFADSTNCVDSNHVDTVLKFLEDLKNSMNLVNQNISLFKNYINHLDELISNSQSDNSDNDEKYNTDSNEKNIESQNIIIENTLQIENLLHSILEYSEFHFEGVDVYSTTEVVASSSTISIPPEPYIENENTLIISEIKNKIILPYHVSELNQLLKDNPEKYANLEDVIEKEYTVPFALYKNPSIARFREAFKLVRNREHKSIKSAFDLGMELLFNYNLHPAIISACKTLDELDIYLDYLENGETDKFDFFKVVFEIAPVVVKNKSK